MVQGDQSLSCPEVKEGPEREELSNQKEKHQDQRIPKEEENVEKEALWRERGGLKTEKEKEGLEKENWSERPKSKDER